MVININGYKKWAGKCLRQLFTYKRNMMILCQGREDNPIHTDAFKRTDQKFEGKKSNMG